MKEYFVHIKSLLKVPFSHMALEGGVEEEQQEEKGKKIKKKKGKK